MDTISIKSSLYNYSVDFTDDFSNNLKTFSESTAYIIDENVYNLYKNKFESLDSSKIYFMKAVEHKKNMDTVLDIIHFFQSIGVRKNWKVVCFGGGITQDVTTISCNLYLRNIDWYFFPTTLLSMCDSCIGGKCGINFANAKNQIGVFYPPKNIFIDVRFINTLSYGDYLNGWGELLKFALTSDPKFYEELEQETQLIPCNRIAYYIHKGLYTKKVVIEEDEFESDLRRILNYGHTFGHALEAYTENLIPHGQGVIWGIDVVNFIAWKEGLISEQYYLDIKSLIKKNFLKKEVVVNDPEKLYEIIKTDKKVKGNIMSFAMLDAPSHLIVYPMQIDNKLKSLFFDYLKETHVYYCN